MELEKLTNYGAPSREGIPSLADVVNHRCRLAILGLTTGYTHLLYLAVHTGIICSKKPALQDNNLVNIAVGGCVPALHMTEARIFVWLRLSDFETKSGFK